MKRYLFNISRRKGFTLIELMIVIAIIGILAVVAIPNFISYRLKAFNTAAVNDVRSVYSYVATPPILEACLELCYTKYECTIIIINRNINPPIMQCSGCNDGEKRNCSISSGAYSLGVMLKLKRTGNNTVVSGYHSQGNMTYCSNGDSHSGLDFNHCQ